MCVYIVQIEFIDGSTTTITAFYYSTRPLANIKHRFLGATAQPELPSCGHRPIFAIS